MPATTSVGRPDAAPAANSDAAAATLRCVACGRPFDFAGGEAAIVLRHTAYGYDFVHDGACLAAAREVIFAEPGYDRAAFGRDPERRRVLAAQPAAGWGAVLSPAAQGSVRLEPLRWWAVVEHRDGSLRTEGVVHDADWLDEPGGAEFPEATREGRGWLGYTALNEGGEPVQPAAWDPRERTPFPGGALPAPPERASVLLAA
jgi:hypothetical protein